MKILVLQGPNLNTLGQREPHIYGYETLEDIHQRLRQRAKEHGAELVTFQSNHEGALIDFTQKEAPGCQAIIINPGALSHYSIALRDCLAGAGLPIVEVHLSNIHAREEFRHRSVIAPIARGTVVGLGWRGYLAALDAIVGIVQAKS